jgi:homoserine O-acetyltransferase
MSNWIRTAAALAGLALGMGAQAQLPAEKKVFTLAQYTTLDGKTLRDVRVGYESYGKLNAAADNAIIVAPGRWDAMIGPGKAFDTDRYFVLSVGALAGVEARDFIHLEKALADSLGIRRFTAVAVVDVRDAHDRDFDFD